MSYVAPCNISSTVTHLEDGETCVDYWTSIDMAPYLFYTVETYTELPNGDHQLGRETASVKHNPISLANIPETYV